MDDTQHTDSPSSGRTNRSGVMEGLRRIPEGLKDGSLVGLCCGALTAGGLLALDSLAFGGVLSDKLLHVADFGDAALFTAKTAGVHAIAHAGLDAYHEFKEGKEGISEDQDMYHQYVESLEHKVRTLEHTLEPEKTKNYSFDGPNPSRSEIVKAIIARRERANNPAFSPDLESSKRTIVGTHTAQLAANDEAYRQQANAPSL